MADAADSKSVARKGVWVRLPPPAPICRFREVPDEPPVLFPSKKTVFSGIKSV
jgi:hypothetical protein